jgi:ribokinase
VVDLVERIRTDNLGTSGRLGTVKPSSKKGALLSVLGAINWDISLFEDRFARPGEEMAVRRVEEFSGGKGGNVSVAAARILGPGRAAFVGALGSDEVCDRQLDELKTEGVVVDGVIRIPGVQSGRAYILIDGRGRKTIHTHFGANERVSPRHVRTGGAAKTISRSEMVVIMDPPTEVSAAAAQLAKKAGAKVLYSPGVRTQEGVASLEAVLKNADFLVLDRIELMNIYKADDEEGAVQMAREKHPRMGVVATLGSEGCIVGADGMAGRASGFDASELGGTVVNTTGCGDAFLGVFASYLMMGRGPLESANWANLAGAIKATKVQTRGSPARRELEGAMKRVDKGRRSALGFR